MKPNIPQEVLIRNVTNSISLRRHAIALYDVAQLKDFTDNDLADWLEHFAGYSYDEAVVEEIERETFIDDQGQVDDINVVMNDPDYKGYVVPIVDPKARFKTQDEAYEFFCTEYDVVLRKLGIIS